MPKLLLACLLFIFPVLSTAETPLLQIDSGGHGSLIGDIAFTKDGQYLVSAGDDKVIRVWDIEQQRTVRTIRGQVGAGEEGKIFAMALSADNRYLAAGGWTHKECAGRCGDIRLYDFASGELLALLKGHTNSVVSMAFSADGRWLISGSSDKNAMIWDVSSRQRRQVLRGHTDHIYAVAFTPDSQRVVTGSFDHDLKLWQVSNGHLLATLSGHTDKVRAVVVTPNNQIISGSWDRSIRRWNGNTGAFIDTLVEDQGSQIASLSVSGDGRLLLAGTSGGGSYDTHLYRLNDGKRLHRYQGHNNIVLATALSPDNRWAATAGGSNQEIDIWDVGSGIRQHRLGGVGQPVWAVGFSADGEYLAWGKTSGTGWSVNDYGELEYQLRLANATQPLGNPQTLDDTSGFIRARDTHGDWQLRHQRGGSFNLDAILNIQYQGETKDSIERSSTDGYDHRSYTFTPDGQHIISGGIGGFLSYYDRNGNKLGDDFIGHTGDVWSVAVSPDGRLLVSGSHDQTVRLWRIDTRELLMTLFQGTDGEWVAWTEQGYYTSSVNGDQMIGWQINRGVDKAADYVAAEQLRRHFYRPDIIDQSIRLLSAELAVAQAKNTDFSLVDLLNNQPPVFRIVDVKQSANDPGLLEVTLKFSNNPQTIPALEIYVDDRQVRLRGGIEGQYLLSAGLIKATISKGTNVFIRASNSTGRSTTQKMDIKHLQSSSTRKPGKLYLLSIGVDAYPALDKPLEFAHNDATGLRDVLLDHTSEQFSELVPVVMTDKEGEEPTAENIGKALRKLAENMSEDDTLIVFLAGHGESSGQDYLFLAADARKRSGVWVEETVLKWNQLLEPLKLAAGRRILLLDTCQAGNAFNPRLVKDAADEQIAILTATDGPYSAQEITGLGHGVFTYALLQGLKGAADKAALHPDKTVSLRELINYVRAEVMHLTKGYQRPVGAIPYSVEFMLAGL